MTLHWWMHWFWITANVVIILGNPLSPSTEDPQIRDPNQMSNTSPPLSSTSVEKLDKPTKLEQQENFRTSKAIGVYPPSNNADLTSGRQGTIAPDEILTNLKTKSKSAPENITADFVKDKTSTYNGKTQVSRFPDTKKENKIMWILTSNKTSKNKNDEKISEVFRNLSTSEYESLTVLPLQKESSSSKLVVDKSTPSSPDRENIRNLNVSEDLAVDEDFVEPHIIATAASILEGGLSESTRLSRARSAFTSDFQRNQKQEESHHSESSDDDNDKDNISVNKEHNDASTSATDIAIITGSCLVSLAFFSTIASLGFIVYRRRYLNPPQSLNNDKCSNPDSSGYIDDSTIRDNSEEMYSLDNDSFLNSLEAMTIQNYWTDSVKHTKL